MNHNFINLSSDGVNMHFNSLVLGWVSKAGIRLLRSLYAVACNIESNVCMWPFENWTGLWDFGDLSVWYLCVFVYAYMCMYVCMHVNQF